MEFWLGISIFVISYLLIVSEKIPKTFASLGGAAVMLLLGIIDQDTAFYGHFLEEGSERVHSGGTDLNVLVLLGAMMVLVRLLADTGVFAYLAIMLVRLTRASPIGILVALCLATAVLSALLDNVTTVLLTVPITLLVTQQLEVKPMPYLISQALASNIGGTATMIGDPPNILIASRAGLTFNEFVFNLGPAVLLILAPFLLILTLVFRRRLQTSRELRAKVLSMNPERAITNRPALYRGLAALGFCLVGFMASRLIHREPATIALLASSALVVFNRSDLHSIIKAIEFDTILYFFGLFILVGGLVHIGAIAALSKAVLGWTGGDLFLVAMILVWFVGLASSLIDNVSLVATIIPFVEGMRGALILPDGLPEEAAIRVLYWSLALGACLGGNGTLVGAAANLVTAGIAKKAGHPIRFTAFLAFGLPCLLGSLALASLYVWGRYF